MILFFSFVGRHKYIKYTIMIMIDCIIAALAAIVPLVVRFGIFDMDPVYLHRALVWMPADMAITVSIMVLMGGYNRLWSFISLVDIISIGKATIVIEILIVIYRAIILGQTVSGHFLPISWYFGNFCIMAILFPSARMSVRVFKLVARRFSSKSNQEKILLVGAGMAGNILIREIENKKSGGGMGEVSVIVDDDPCKCGNTMSGIKIAGNRHDIPELVRQYNITEIMIALPSAARSEIRGIVEICYDTPAKVKILPGIAMNLKTSLTSELREVDYEDLLGRDIVRVNMEEIDDFIKGKTVLVTGGGGSIGSELCRQIASYGPARLIIFDIYENNAYNIEMELKVKYPEMQLDALIGSVRDEVRVRSIMETCKPQIIFHAAAHKHVPLMEASPFEAIKNNVFATMNVARLAGEFGADKFVLISTDKAVNPTNIMGASKRICEMVIQSMNSMYPEETDTTFAAVRFGNVLGSNGSVIPLFKEQIKRGGPVTVTHPEITRFFMTIPEAVSLVLQAGCYAGDGEIFVLDMGEPVKIDDMARNLIKLAGYIPDEDIKIKYIGLRPGEKICEEILMDEEGLQDTANHKIKVGQKMDFSDHEFQEKIEELKMIAFAANAQEWQLKEMVKEIVPGYKTVQK